MITPPDTSEADLEAATGAEVLGVCDPELAAEALPDVLEPPVEAPKLNTGQLTAFNRSATAQSMEDEFRVYDLAREGKSISAIAIQLHLSRNHCRNLLERAFSTRIRDLEKSAAKFRHKETLSLLRRRLEIDVAIEKAMKKGEYEAIARLAASDVAISAQLAKLHGLNAAEKAQVAHVHLTYDQCREFIDAGQQQILEE